MERSAHGATTSICRCTPSRCRSSCRRNHRQSSQPLPLNTLSLSEERVRERFGLTPRAKFLLPPPNRAHQRCAPIEKNEDQTRARNQISSRSTSNRRVAPHPIFFFQAGSLKP